MKTEIKFDREMFAAAMAATEDLRDVFWGYGLYGLRAQEEDTEQVGSTMIHTSHNFGGDFGDIDSDEGEELPGVSSIECNKWAIQSIGYSGYYGSVMYLIAGHKGCNGYDYGELIIEDPVVLAKLEIVNGQMTITAQAQEAEDCEGVA